MTRNLQVLEEVEQQLTQMTTIQQLVVEQEWSLQGLW